MKIHPSHTSYIKTVHILTAAFVLLAHSSYAYNSSSYEFDIYDLFIHENTSPTFVSHTASTKLNTGFVKNSPVISALSNTPGSKNLAPTNIAPYTPDISHLENIFKTDEDIIYYMNAYFDYKYDPERPTAPKSPQDFNTTRTGDCKDSSVFFGHFASLINIKGNQITYRYLSAFPDAGHVINLYYSQEDLEENILWIQSNGQKFGPIRDESDFLKYALIAPGPAADQAKDFLYFPMNNKDELHLAE